jgi:hypothetical protein
MVPILANLVALIHGLVILCVISGSVAAMSGWLRRYPRLELAFYFILILVVASDLLAGQCLLTGLEQSLRNSHLPGTAYRGSFIGHYAPFLPAFIHTYGGPALVAGALAAFPAWRLVDRSNGRVQLLADTSGTER